MFGADVLRGFGHGFRVLSHNELIDRLKRLKADGTATNAAIARVLNLPSSRIAEVFDGTRRVTVDEMKALVEHYGLEPSAQALSAETIAPLLDALLPLVPAGEQSARSVEVVSQALAYGLQLLGGSGSSEASEDALKVAARAAASRFRDLVLQ